MIEQTAPPVMAPLPTSAWIFGALCLTGEVLQLLDRGASSSNALFVLASVVVSAALVWWFADGVMRARTGRVIVVWILLALGAGIEVVFLLGGDAEGASGLAWLGMAVSLGQVAAYAVYTRSSYFRTQEMLSGKAGTALGGILLLAVLTGALGGLMQQPGTQDGSQNFHVGL